jgi:hypothetical protein
MNSLNKNEIHLDSISSWIAYWMQRNVALEASSQEGPFYLEAHGCYDMGYDCDATNLSDGHR